MKNFTPGPDTRLALRRALGQFATGVTLVTVAGGRGPMGITANSFASVSLDPPLILWCPAKSSARHDALVAAGDFALHVLGQHQRELAKAFARRADAFELCEWETGAGGIPLIAGCAARFECRTEERIDAGDHTIILGRVRHVTTGETEPLVFHRGEYGGFTGA
jgi:flavin reductase (DIM6/NTAB) family NADH-FMN oxidoreductase RutF